MLWTGLIFLWSAAGTVVTSVQGDTASAILFALGTVAWGFILGEELYDRYGE